MIDENDSISTAIDSTGFSLTNASYHYTVVIKIREKGKRKQGRPRKLRAIKRYLKVTFVVDTNTQTILVTSIRRGPDNDNKDFVRSYKKLDQNSSVDIDLVLADKGYNSENNHKYAREILGAESIIPARMNRSKDFKTRGKYRKEMKSGYDLDRYRQRNKVETVNSVIKRKMGDCVRAKKVLNQNREILFMVMAYNIERGLNYSLFIIIGILESLPIRNDTAPQCYVQIQQIEEMESSLEEISWVRYEIITSPRCQFHFRWKGIQWKKRTLERRGSWHQMYPELGEDPCEC